MPKLELPAEWLHDVTRCVRWRGKKPACDREREEMQGDVPAPATYSLVYNVFNDKRQFLGFTNMMSTFTGEARSADTGATHIGGGWSGRPTDCASGGAAGATVSPIREAAA